MLNPFRVLILKKQLTQRSNTLTAMGEPTLVFMSILIRTSKGFSF